MHACSQKPLAGVNPAPDNMKLTWHTITGTPENILRTEHNNLLEAIEIYLNIRKSVYGGLDVLFATPMFSGRIHFAKCNQWKRRARKQKRM